MKPESKVNSRWRVILLGVCLCMAVVILFIFRETVWRVLLDGYAFISDREKIKSFVHGFGDGAPVIFITIQVLQVVFAPVPGEATGFIGGYLFGTLPGFIYSSIGLAAGSWINLMLGRFLGRKCAVKLVPARKLERFDSLFEGRSIFVIFIFFLFPGFPKDYLCIFLGFSNLPLKFMFILSAVGRMPGTLLLSLQGAALFERSYTLFAIVLALCAAAAGVTWYYREKVYQWGTKSGGRERKK